MVKTQTTTMALLSLIISGMAVIGVSQVKAVEVGDTKEKEISIDERVRITPETVQAVDGLFLDLEDGEWMINSNLNLFFRGSDGAFPGDARIYFGSFISEDVPAIDYHDGRITTGSAPILGGRADTNSSLVGRRIIVHAAPGTTKRVYLVLWVHQDQGKHNLTFSETYGFIYAHYNRRN